MTFTTIYPGWYQGRATHIHVEVTLGGRWIKVTQMAFPDNANNAVHTAGAYASRGRNPLSNTADGIFARLRSPRERPAAVGNSPRERRAGQLTRFSLA